jgi:acyl-coenzyme A synthetase/AMP-(fatty) acid ligase
VSNGHPPVPAEHVDAWVDDLLRGADDQVCLSFDTAITYGDLRQRVDRRQADLSAAGLARGGLVAMRLPPGPAFVVNLLAAWRSGAQVLLLDHRLTAYEVDAALRRTAPQLVVSGPAGPGRLRGYHDATAVTNAYPGGPAATEHVLLQLSSGSTGPSKVIGRSAASLLAELDRYRRIPGTPRPGGRIVLLASMVHVLGLVGGLMYGLYEGVPVVVPRLLTAESVLQVVAGDASPATVLGVPFHIQLLTAAAQSRPVPQLARMTVGGELVRPATAREFTEAYGVPLGVMYGMTEAGVIATDLNGEHYPALTPAPGMALRAEAGQLLLATPDPYVGATAPGRWVDGWLRTRDAGTVDRVSGRVTVHGRLDSQVSIGGLKVDLTEVEETVASSPGVVEAVVVYDGGIDAFVVLDDGTTADELSAALAERLAGYKCPRRLNVVRQLPRTATGKLVRAVDVLRTVADAVPESARAVLR